MQQKVPLPGKIFARCIPKRLFAGLFECMARISCQREPVFGCMVRESCHEGALFPSEAPSGMHEAKKLPQIVTRERTVAESCHRRTLENASREHFAIGERPGTHQGIILPWQAARKCTAATPCHGSLLQECFSTTYCQEGPRLPELAAKSQWSHGVERRHQNEASANSTPHADASNKP